MKKILLPTDLTVQSLWAAKQIIQQARYQGALTIYVVHMIEMPSSINDLLSLGRNRKYPTMSPAFIDALQILRSKAAESNIAVHFEYVYGNNSRVLKNFMQGQGIAEVLLLNGYEYSFSQNVSVDFIPFFKRMKTAVNHIPFNIGNFSEFQLLSILLNNGTEEKNEEVALYTSSLAV